LVAQLLPNGVILSYAHSSQNDVTLHYSNKYFYKLQLSKIPCDKENFEPIQHFFATKFPGLLYAHKTFKGDFILGFSKPLPSLKIPITINDQILNIPIQHYSIAENNHRRYALRIKDSPLLDIELLMKLIGDYVEILETEIQSYQKSTICDYVVLWCDFSSWEQAFSFPSSIQEKHSKLSIRPR
jgi:hypothetical protein